MAPLVSLKNFFDLPQLVAKAGCTVALSERWWHHWHHWWSQKGRSWCLSCVSRVNLLGSAMVNGDMTKCTGTLGIYTKCTSVPSVTQDQWTSGPSEPVNQLYQYTSVTSGPVYQGLPCQLVTRPRRQNRCACMQHQLPKLEHQVSTLVAPIGTLVAQIGTQGTMEHKVTLTTEINPTQSNNCCFYLDELQLLGWALITMDMDIVIILISSSSSLPASFLSSQLSSSSFCRCIK